MASRPFVLFLSLWLCACAAGTGVATRSWEIEVAPDANQRSPVPVDLVLVRTEALVPVVAELTARQWFDLRPQLLLDHPNGLDSRSWEFVPGQVAAFDDLPFENRDGFALFVFANFLTEETQAVRVDGMREFRLKLLVSGFVVEPVN